MITPEGYTTTEQGNLIEKRLANHEVNDLVDHPNHYCSGKIECIEYIRDKLTAEQYIGWLKGNILKEVTREGLKEGNSRSQEAGKIRYYACELERFMKEQGAK